MEVINSVFIYFILYSVIGWIAEVVFCLIINKTLTNRGFLHGPYCPIYGVGALCIVYFLEPLRENWILVFFASAILTSILEYITSVVMEKIFNARWWDYSNNKFNINGRVCLLNSVLFGILGVLAIYFLHPFVIMIMKKTPINIFSIVSTGLMIIFSIDLSLTIIKLANLKEKLEKLKNLRLRLEEKLNAITQKDLKPYIAEVLEKQIKDLIYEKRAFENRLLKSFPSLKSEKFSMQIDEIKKAMNIKGKKN